MTPNHGNVPSPSSLGPQPQSSQTGHPCLEMKCEELLLLQGTQCSSQGAQQELCSAPGLSKASWFAWVAPQQQNMQLVEGFIAPTCCGSAGTASRVLWHLSNMMDASSGFCHGEKAWKDEIENQGEVKSEGEPQRVLTPPQGWGNPCLRELSKAVSSAALLESFQQFIPGVQQGSHPGRGSGVTGSLRTFRQQL